MASARVYHYWVDVKGQLFLRGVTRPYRDPVFLDFFFARVRACDPSLNDGHKWVSRCGRELNYIEPMDTPIVFNNISIADDGTASLHFGASLLEPFDASRLCVKSHLGRLYYRAQKHPAAVEVGACLCSSSLTFDLVQNGTLGFNEITGQFLCRGRVVEELPCLKSNTK